jgi:hypothetical protein
LIVCALLAANLLGCAKRSENVAAAYVSPLAYEQFNCGQLTEEAGRLSQRAAELSGVQDRKRTGDIVATTAAIIVFWPAAFLVSGDDTQTAEPARLKGSSRRSGESQFKRVVARALRVGRHRPVDAGVWPDSKRYRND